MSEINCIYFIWNEAIVEKAAWFILLFILDVNTARPASYELAESHIQRTRNKVGISPRFEFRARPNTFLIGETNLASALERDGVPSGYATEQNSRIEDSRHFARN